MLPARCGADIRTPPVKTHLLGRVAQRESTSLTSRGSQVRSLSRPPSSPTKPRVSRTTKNRPFLWGFLPSSFPCAGLRRHLWSSRLISGLASLHPKIPFPAAGHDGLGVREELGMRNAEATGGYYWGFNPSASNCSLHSAGASRNRSTPMPRGSRPSTAALTRPGARKASEMVMLTWRTLHFCRVAIS